MVVCDVCYKMTGDNSSFCEHCGGKLKNANKTAGSSVKKSNSGKKEDSWLPLKITLVVIILIVKIVRLASL